MPRLTRSVTTPLALLVVTPLLLVYATFSGFAAGRARTPSAPVTPASPTLALPAPVVEMREAILAAARSGDIEELRLPIEWNELPPEIDAPAADEVMSQAPGSRPAAPAIETGRTDPIARLRRASTDGLGHEVLGALIAILDTEPAVVPHGRDVENSKLYVWPAIALRPLSEASADDRSLVERISPSDTEASLRAGTYLGWRIVIGADGTWHSLGRGPRP